MDILQLADKDTFNDRIQTCKICPFWSDHFKLLGIRIFKEEPQCTKCKCHIDTKARLQVSKCPEGKWEA